MLEVRMQFISQLSHTLWDKIAIISYRGLLSAIAVEKGSLLWLFVTAITQLKNSFVKNEVIPSGICQHIYVILCFRTTLIINFHSIMAFVRLDLSSKM